MVFYSSDAHGYYTKLDVRHPAKFDHQGAQVWRVTWNVTGTILASSGGDGCVRLWKGKLQSCMFVDTCIYYCIVKFFQLTTLITGSASPC